MRVELTPETLVGVSAGHRGRFHAPSGQFKRDYYWVGKERHKTETEYAACDAITLHHYFEASEIEKFNTNLAEGLTPCPKCFKAAK